jgi:hypothetical protein
MSGQADSAGEKPAEKPPGLMAAQVMQFVRENFVLISAAAVLIGVALSATFLASYLSVFDWHLIFFVQYTDIVTVGLIAVGIISGSLTFLVSTVLVINNVVISEGRNRRTQIVVIVVLGISALAFNFWGAAKSGEGYFHILSGIAVLFNGVFFLWLVWWYVKHGTIPTPIQLGSLVFLLIVCAAAAGQWLGRSILEVGQPLDIKMKDAAMTETKLIIELSRHTILLKNRDIYVVPTADITQFHEVAAPSQF